jgi:hypothetical protein
MAVVGDWRFDDPFFAGGIGDRREARTRNLTPNPFPIGKGNKILGQELNPNHPAASCGRGDKILGEESRARRPAPLILKSLGAECYE